MYIYVSPQLQLVHTKLQYSSIDSALASNDLEAITVLAIFFEVSMPNHYSVIDQSNGSTTGTFIMPCGMYTCW